MDVHFKKCKMLILLAKAHFLDYNFEKAIELLNKPNSQRKTMRAGKLKFIIIFPQIYAFQGNHDEAKKHRDAMEDNLTALNREEKPQYKVEEKEIGSLLKLLQQNQYLLPFCIPLRKRNAFLQELINERDHRILVCTSSAAKKQLFK